MSKILVTGGAGFIGSHLVDRLLDLGHKVIVIDDFSLGKEENLFNQKNNKNLTIIKKNACEDISNIFLNEKIEAIFHLAAIPQVQFSINNPLESHNANLNSTFNLINLSRKFNVKRFIFSSSSAVYGDQDTMPYKEAMTPNPLSPYALHKLVGEYYCKLFNMLYGIETISLRYFNVFGPRQNPEGSYANLIPRFIKLIGNNIPPVINGDGKQTRDFVYVSDVVEANISALDTQNKECFGSTFNIGSGMNLSVNEITGRIIKISNKSIKPSHGQSVIEPRNTLADISNAKKMLGWMPKVSFEEGLRETYKYFNL